MFYIGTNSDGELTAIRRHILGSFENLPIAAEYVHRDAFDIAERNGKDTFLLIRAIGTTNLFMFFATKSWIDDLAGCLAFLSSDFGDRALRALSRLFPSHLPRRMKEFRDRYQHHLLLKMSGEGIVTRALNATSGARQVEGGSGSDMLYGSAGRDVLTGLTGQGCFCVRYQAESEDECRQADEFLRERRHNPAR